MKVIYFSENNIVFYDAELQKNYRHLVLNWTSYIYRYTVFCFSCKDDDYLG